MSDRVRLRPSLGVRRVATRLRQNRPNTATMRNMNKTRTRWSNRPAIMMLAALLTFNQPEARAASASASDEIVAADLLTVKGPRSEAESRLRVIRLTTRSGAVGYGDYLDYGHPAENAEETLARLVNRYAEQDHKEDIFMTDPSMRAVGGGRTILGQTARQIVNAPLVVDRNHNAFYPRGRLRPDVARRREGKTGHCPAGSLA